MKRVPTLVLRAAQAFALVALLTAPLVAQDGPQVFDVVISIDTSSETMSFSLDPVTVERGRGDRVVFSAPGVEMWSVSFAEGSPSPFRNRLIQGSGRQSRNVPVRQDVEPGAYKYDVSVTVGGRTYTVDPQIIVRPGSGGGG